MIDGLGLGEHPALERAAEVYWSGLRKHSELLEGYFDNTIEEANRKNDEGTLTIGETVAFGFYRLLEGEYAGRVIIKTSGKIADYSVLYFADYLTWIYADDIASVRCERAFPQFNTPFHEVDRSQALHVHRSEQTQGHLF